MKGSFFFSFNQACCIRHTWSNWSLHGRLLAASSQNLWYVSVIPLSLCLLNCGQAPVKMQTNVICAVGNKPKAWIHLILLNLYSSIKCLFIIKSMELTSVQLLYALSLIISLLPRVLPQLLVVSIHSKKIVTLQALGSYYWEILWSWLLFSIVLATVSTPTSRIFCLTLFWGYAPHYSIYPPGLNVPHSGGLCDGHTTQC